MIIFSITEIGKVDIQEYTQKVLPSNSKESKDCDYARTLGPCKLIYLREQPLTNNCPCVDKSIFLLLNFDRVINPRTRAAITEALIFLKIYNFRQ